ncbi:histidine ammonia-lyase [Staphylococcus saccharolyticus]|mgnify:FL=1|uniref:Histidine ammonia-lyase n=1 Tax=Staphylococcus saccharolyticus TaxID=33028 RepID=A0A380GYR0_9STAP|nr:histidine ammonia-lyase [Staphylococcus saccharolyticus]
MILFLDRESLTIKEIKKLLNQDLHIDIREEALECVRNSCQVVERIIEKKETMYGITTGFGLFSDVRIDSGQYNELQVNLIRSHACSIGEPFSEEVALVMMILRLNTLLKGHSGVTLELVEQLKYFINERIIPVIPQQGSLGAYGDLASLSHLALGLIGEGDVYYDSQQLTSFDVLDKLGRKPLKLQAKEGLALIDGTQAMTAQGVINCIEAEDLAYQAE